MKIVYNIPSVALKAGMERVLANKVNYMIERWGAEVIIITLEQNGRPLAYDFSDKVKFYHLDIGYERCRTNNVFKNKILRMLCVKEHKRKLKQILHQEHPDITISMMNGKEREWLYKIKDGSKKVLEFHFSYFRFCWSKDFIHHWKIKRLERKIKYYDKFVVLTQEDKKDWGDKENMEVIPNALTFYPVRSADLSVKRIITVGRLDCQKGFDRLIDIWAQVEPSFQDWKLSIVGSGTEYERLKQQINTLNLKNIELLPARQSIEEEYLNSSIYVMTSRHEGFPMVLHEAMSCGLPVVSYACKCGPKDIIKDKEDGFLVKEGDEKMFVQRLTELMVDLQLRIEMGDAGRKNILRFSEDLIMNQWNDLFRSLLKD